MKKHPVLTHPSLFPSGDVFVLINGLIQTLTQAFWLQTLPDRALSASLAACLASSRRMSRG